MGRGLKCETMHGLGWRHARRASLWCQFISVDKQNVTIGGLLDLRGTSRSIRDPIWRCALTFFGHMSTYETIHSAIWPRSKGNNRLSVTLDSHAYCWIDILNLPGPCLILFVCLLVCAYDTPDYLRPLERPVHIGSSTNTLGPLKPSQMWKVDVVQARLKLIRFCPQVPGKHCSLGQTVPD